MSDDELQKAKRKEYQRIWYLEHKEEVKLRARNYRQEHRAEISAKAHAYGVEHKEELSKKNKIRREAHKEEINARNTIYYHAHKAEESEKSRDYYRRHHDEIRARVDAYRKERIEKIRQFDLERGWRKRGIDVETARYLRDNIKACQICGAVDYLAVDHDHSTGKVRGILCHRCNRILGLQNDNPEYFEKAAEYLRKTKFTPPLKD